MEKDTEKLINGKWTQEEFERKEDAFYAVFKWVMIIGIAFAFVMEILTK
jgi:hypothetical protein